VGIGAPNFNACRYGTNRAPLVRPWGGISVSAVACPQSQFVLAESRCWLGRLTRFARWFRASQWPENVLLGQATDRDCQQEMSAAPPVPGQYRIRSGVGMSMRHNFAMRRQLDANNQRPRLVWISEQDCCLSTWHYFARHPMDVPWQYLGEPLWNHLPESNGVLSRKLMNISKSRQVFCDVCIFAALIEKFG
jgi:hypothetical protein